MTSVQKHQQLVDSSISSDSGRDVMSDLRGNEPVSMIKTVPVTVERKPFWPGEDDAQIREFGHPRVNIAATPSHPQGTTDDNWAARHKHQTVLQQHCEFFDPDNDGIIWPFDTFHSFRKLGFGLILSIFSVFVIHGGFSYPTVSSWLPDPFFRIFLANVHKTKHGSDSGTYDTEGRFIPQKYEDIFSKYADGRDGLNVWEISGLLKGQRLVVDPFGWSAAVFEWVALYLMIWPEDGRIYKEDIRKMYDGSLFYDIAARPAKNRPASRGSIERVKQHEM